jgi:hypothetical protein
MSMGRPSFGGLGWEISRMVVADVAVVVEVCEMQQRQQVLTWDSQWRHGVNERQILSAAWLGVDKVVAAVVVVVVVVVAVSCPEKSGELYID